MKINLPKIASTIIKVSAATLKPRYFTVNTGDGGPDLLVEITGRNALTLWAALTHWKAEISRKWPGSEFTELSKATVEVLQTEVVLVPLFTAVGLCLYAVKDSEPIAPAPLDIVPLENYG